MSKALVAYFSASGVTKRLSENMAEIAKGAKVEEGKRFFANTSADEMKEWADTWL